MYIGKVQGNQPQAQPIVWGKDTVYEHKDIVQIGDNLYEYEEWQYSHNEYMAVLATRNLELEARLTATQQVQDAEITYIGMMTEVL